MNFLSETTGDVSWWDGIVASFTNEWWAFFVGLAVILGVLLVLCIVSGGRIIKLKRVIKVGFNAVLGFALLFVFNLVASAFGVTLVAKWYEWLIIGLAGIPGTILCIVFHFIWPTFW